MASAGLWSALMVPAELPAWGWKVHVSSTLIDAPDVLRITAQTAYEFSTSFKFLPSTEAFLALHFKGSSRLQSGKFVAMYPADERVAGKLMRTLSRRLADKEGQDVLTDRAFGTSRSVFYRWGAFISSGRVNDLGEPEDLVPDGRGQLVPDLRRPAFVLPKGITDPFRPEEDLRTPLKPETVDLAEYTVTLAFRFTSGGGIYGARNRTTGREVVIKEARPHTGFVNFKSAPERLQEEARWLDFANQLRPGLAPELIETFRADGHEFLAIERVPGTPLHDWIARECPLYCADHRSREATEHYVRRVGRILVTIRADLDLLHSKGVAFGDLSSSNILIDEFDVPRLVDFEACTDASSRAPGVATPDFCLLRPKRPMSAKERDEYAFHALAIAFILRLTSLAEFSDHVLAELEKELDERVTVLPRWWVDARDHLIGTTTAGSACKTREVPRGLNTNDRSSLCSSLATGLTDCYSSGARPWLFPSSKRAVEGAATSFSCGDSGVMTTLVAGGYQLPRGALGRFRAKVQNVLTEGSLPLGHDYGLAGVVEACAALGLDDLVERGLDVISECWPRLTRPDLGTGLAGVSLTLARYGRSTEAIAALTAALELTHRYQWAKNGLVNGRSGVVAAACELFDLLPANRKWESCISALLEQELAQTVSLGAESLSLRAETDGSRLLPYLADGTAGLLVALSKASRVPEVVLPASEAEIVQLAADLETPFTLEGTLMNGSVGLAVVQEILQGWMPQLRSRISQPDWSRVHKYLLPVRSGTGTLNPRTLRFDLSHDGGSAGILAALLWLDGTADLNLAGLRIRPMNSESPPTSRALRQAAATTEEAQHGLAPLSREHPRLHP